ncbi:MAG TPA: tRNA lysidine(34) synthetase TilS [Flavobacterium sp.]|nr:tRNA lysidine(34) synthetase TilS [Flavobacterium sp.]
MIIEFEHHIKQNFPQLKNKKLLLAVSGGIDSMVLLHLSYQLKWDFAVAHCNFYLRNEESMADEDFVKTICNEIQVPCFIKKFETSQFASEHKLSIQVAARKLRYDWFNQLLSENKLDYILTAHQLDDQAETFLINLTRGTGLDGLTGIPAVNGNIIRPLLPFTREQLLQYARDNQIQWREDSSNASKKYLRNKLRHDVIPVLKELNPNFLNSFQQTLNNLNQSHSLVTDASDILFKSIVEENNDQLKINISALTKQKNYKAYLYQWLSKYGFFAWNDIFKLITSQSGKQVFSNDYLILKDREHLIVSKREMDTKCYHIEKNIYQINIPLKMTLSHVNFISNSNSNCIFVDAEKISFPLSIRKWQTADFFYPSGMKGKKKLSKYFKDQKMSLIDKENQWLLCSNNNIIWVINQRADERFTVNENTKNILKITTSQ